MYLSAVEDDGGAPGDITIPSVKSVATCTHNPVSCVLGVSRVVCSDVSLVLVVL